MGNFNSHSQRGKSCSFVFLELILLPLKLNSYANAINTFVLLVFGVENLVLTKSCPCIVNSLGVHAQIPGCIRLWFYVFVMNDWSIHILPNHAFLMGINVPHGGLSRWQDTQLMLSEAGENVLSLCHAVTCIYSIQAS